MSITGTNFTTGKDFPPTPTDGDVHMEPNGHVYVYGGAVWIHMASAYKEEDDLGVIVELPENLAKDPQHAEEKFQVFEQSLQTKVDAGRLDVETKKIISVNVGGKEYWYDRAEYDKMKSFYDSKRGTSLFNGYSSTP
jgi:hypothetical protein